MNNMESISYFIISTNLIFNPHANKSTSRVLLTNINPRVVLDGHVRYYSNIELKISRDSIKEYKNIKMELNYWQSKIIYHHNIDEDEYEDEDEENNKECRNHITQLKLRSELIQYDWTKKAISFLAWEKRKQLVTMWARN